MTVTLPAQRREPIFPTRVFSEQAMFAGMIWLAALVGLFILTWVVSFFTPIAMSAWSVGAGIVAWFGFAIGIYLGTSVLPLHVTHGGTRRGYFVQMLGFVALYGALIAVLAVIGQWVETLYYLPFGWIYASDRPALYASATDLPMLLAQSLMLCWLYVLGGLLIGIAWYRSAVLGALMIPIGLMMVGFSGISISGEAGPFNWIERLLPVEPSFAFAAVTHLILYVLQIGLIWIIVRDIPIHGKNASSS